MSCVYHTFEVRHLRGVTFDKDVEKAREFTRVKFKGTQTKAA